MKLINVVLVFYSRYLERIQEDCVKLGPLGHILQDDKQFFLITIVLEQSVKKHSCHHPAYFQY